MRIAYEITQRSKKEESCYQQLSSPNFRFAVRSLANANRNQTIVHYSNKLLVNLQMYEKKIIHLLHYVLNML